MVDLCSCLPFNYCIICQWHIVSLTNEKQYVLLFIAKIQCVKWKTACHSVTVLAECYTASFSMHQHLQMFLNKYCRWNIHKLLYLCPTEPGLSHLKVMAKVKSNYWKSIRDFTIAYSQPKNSIWPIRLIFICVKNLCIYGDITTTPNQGKSGALVKTKKKMEKRV